MFFIRVRDSLIARKQNWQSKNFEKTRYGRNLAKLKNKHQGEKCFVIGNGPSLTKEDLQKLHELNIVTFGTNRIFHMYDQTDWRPTYYASEDIIIIRDIQDTIGDLAAKAKFIPINLKWYENVDIKGADYFLMDYSSNCEATYNMSLDISKSIRCKGTVTITCIQLAIYMGFSEIYLLGVDHNYAKIINENGEVVEDSNIKDYFSDKYDCGIKNQLVHDIGSATLAYHDVEMLSKKLGTFRVYNATRGGKLEVFERVDFEKTIIGRERTSKQED